MNKVLSSNSQQIWRRLVHTLNLEYFYKTTLKSAIHQLPTFTPVSQ